MIFFSNLCIIFLLVHLNFLTYIFNIYLLLDKIYLRDKILNHFNLIIKNLSNLKKIKIYYIHLILLFFFNYC